MPLVRRPAHDVPVEYLGGIRSGDHAYWKYYDFGAARIRKFICKTWGANKAATIEIRLDSPDGKLIGTCLLEPMNGNMAYAIHETSVESVSGKHALVLVFKGEEADVDLLNLEWFTFA